MKDTIESIKKEEEELERLAFGTPPKTDTKDEEATKSDAKEETVHTTQADLVNQQAQSTAATEQTAQTEDWEKRYKNLRASRDQKLYETKSQLSAALSTINTLQAKVDKLRTAIPKVDPLEGVFTDKDKENLGDATVEALERATRTATEAATKPLQEQLEEERKKRREQNELNAQNAAADATGIFLQRIANAVPNWEAINFDPAFVTWCDGPDHDGVPRKTYFAQAEAQGNSALIIRYMREYEAQKPAPKEDKLAGKITPTGEDAGATQVTNETKDDGIIYRDEIDKFYDDLSRGKYQGRAKEVAIIEKKIDIATMTGKIRRRK